ncbi:site-specific integrase [Parabacteroides bouchesdurhonensis]|uniref:site-specific integrase n=1 Tax=Parabacteroides bouchesdurhonensis TaxID=1936995 RepID=UPI000C84E6D8|nr:site-specific integrase [Parabacteroides bouchesdurhonensis]
MEKVIYNLVFNRKKQLNAEGKALIQIEAYLNRQKKYFSTKIYIKPYQWDNKRKVIKNHPNVDALNQYLYNYISELERIELDAIYSGKSFSLVNLKEKQQEVVPSSFSAFMENEIMHSNLKPSTLKNHLSTLHLLAFYKKDIAFDDLNFNFLYDFEYYLLKKGYHRNTIAKHMKHLKRYINLAINKDLFDLQKYPFRKYKIKYMETKRTHLTPEELSKLENLNLEGKRSLRRCLDMFLFSCYTGLRFSDIVSITDANFLHIEDNLWLIYSSVKTDVSVRLPLFLLFDGKSIPIYERYHSKARKTLFNVPVSANSNINKQLRRICQLASIDKKISFHTARHTNATLLLYNGANITTVQKLLGHKSVRTTEIYSNIMDMTIVRDLEEIRHKNGVAG